MQRQVLLPSEDVGAVVVDVGSFETRAGFAGEDSPKSVYPSLVGVTAGPDDATMTGVRSSGAADDEQRKKWKVGSAELVSREGGG